MDCHDITRDEFVDSFGGITEHNASYYGCGGVVFSAVKRGRSIVVHVGCKRENMRNLREACASFVNHMLSTFEWCNMVIATVSLHRKSVINLCRKLGFENLGVYQFETGEAQVMVKKR